MKANRYFPLAALVLATQISACGGDVLGSTADRKSPGAPAKDVICGEGTVPLWATSTIGENKPIEAEGTLSAGAGCGYYVMTGLGGRVTATSNWTTVNLWGRRVYADGTMSAETRQDYGQVAAPEQEVHVPEGAVVVGVGAGEQNNNVSVIRLSYRYVSVVNGHLQLVGPVYTVSSGTGNVEMEYVLTDDVQVYVGVGFGNSANNVTRLRWYSGILQ